MSKFNSQGRAGVPLVVSTGSEKAWHGFNEIFGNAFRRMFTDADMTSKVSQAWAFGVTKEHRHYGMDTYALGLAGRGPKVLWTPTSELPHPSVRLTTKSPRGQQGEQSEVSEQLQLRSEVSRTQHKHCNLEYQGLALNLANII